MKKMIKISTLTVTASLLAVAAQADKWSDQFPHIKNTGDIAGECSYESMSKKDYSGQKLQLIRMLFLLLVNQLHYMLSNLAN